MEIGKIKVIDVANKILTILVEEKITKGNFETITEVLRNEYEMYGIITEDAQKCIGLKESGRK